MRCIWHRFDTSSAAVTLTLTNCHYVDGVSLAGNGVFVYTFYNSGPRPAFVTDGTREYFLPAAGRGDSASYCMCHGGELTCTADAPLVMKIANRGANTVSTECVTLTDSNPISIDFSQPVCNNKYCPHCFNLDTNAASAEQRLTLTNCNYYQGHNLGTGYVTKFQFMNTGTSYVAEVTDGIKGYQIWYDTTGPSATQCTCFNGKLHCDATTTMGQWPGRLVVTGSFSVFEFAQIGQALPMLDYTVLGSSAPTRSSSRLSSAPSVMDSANLELATFLKSFLRVGLLEWSNRAIGVRLGCDWGCFYWFSLFFF